MITIERKTATTDEIVQKLWNLSNLLRDDGINFSQYVTELTYILFLKLAKETQTESQLLAPYRWDTLHQNSEKDAPAKHPLLDTRQMRSMQHTNR